MRGIIVVAAVSLGGCAGSLVGDAMLGPEGLARQDDAYCRKLGALPGSPEYVQCRQIETVRRDNRHARAADTMAAGLAIATTRPPAPPPAPQPLDCTRTGRDTMRCQ